MNLFFDNPWMLWPPEPGRPLCAWAGFGSGWMLLWGLAAIVPLLIHLYSRRRVVEVDWAATSFLSAVLQRRVRQARFRQWILLAVRMAILLLLAVSLADPSWMERPEAGPVTPRLPRHYVLVLDASYSMDRRWQDQAAWDHARHEAAKVVRQAAVGDAFSVVVLAQPSRSMLAQPSRDTVQVRTLLESLRLRHTGADLPSGLQRVQEAIERAEEDVLPITRHEVVIFSDLGHNTWRSVRTRQVQRQLARLARQGRIRLLPIGNEPLANLAVTDVAVDQPAVVAGQEATISARVRNWSRRTQRRQIELRVDEHPVDQRSITVPPGEQQVVAFSWRFSDPGDYVLEVHATPDGLPLDDAAYASVSVREQLRVLCIAGSLDAARYVAAALQPVDDDRGYPQVTLGREHALLASTLSRYDALFLCNVARFRPAERQALMQYLQDGGGLVIWVGDQVDVENYNVVLGPRDGAPALLPARLETLHDEGPYPIDPRDYEHPLAQPFQGTRDGGLLSTPIWKYRQLAPWSSGEAQIALGLAGGDPLIVEQAVAQGRVVLIATAAWGRPDETAQLWSAWHLWPSFPPVVDQLLQRAVGRRFAGRNLRVGQSLVGQLSPGVLAQQVRITRRPEAETTQVSVDELTRRWSMPVESRGVYRVAVDDDRSARQLVYAVNLPPAEGDLTPWPVAQLPRQIDWGDSPAEMDVPQELVPRYALFRWLLVGLLILLVAEPWLAWWLRRTP